MNTLAVFVSVLTTFVSVMVALASVILIWLSWKATLKAKYVPVNLQALLLDSEAAMRRNGVSEVDLTYQYGKLYVHFRRPSSRKLVIYDVECEPEVAAGIVHAVVSLEEQTRTNSAEAIRDVLAKHIDVLTVVPRRRR